MSIPFGFGQPGDNAPDGSNPLAGLGEMLQSLGRALSQSSGEPAVTGKGLLESAADTAGATELAAHATSSAIDGLAAMCAGWVDTATSLPSTPAAMTWWTPRQWMSATADDWARFAAPVADTMADATTALMRQAEIPAEQAAQMAAMLQPMQQMLKSLTVAMMQQQLGAAIGKLSNDVMYAGELPMVAPADAAAVLPAAVDTWAKGLNLPTDQVYPWIVTREIAAHRLASSTPWLAGVLRNAVLAHSTGVHVDQEKIAQAMQSIDPMNPESLQELLTSGVLEPAESEQQRMAALKLQTLIALIDGWVDVVGADACPSWVPVAALDEAYRRRRATDGPAQQALGTLVGLEVNPRQVREAAALWRRLTQEHGINARDALWAHPDLLPSAEDLADPSAFIDSIGSDELRLPDEPEQ